MLGPVFLLTLFTAVVSIQTPGEEEKIWSVLAVQTHWIKSEYAAFLLSLYLEQRFSFCGLESSFGRFSQ